MSVTDLNRRRIQPIPAETERQRNRESRQYDLALPVLKASLWGGSGLAVLMLVSLVPPPDELSWITSGRLIVPGFIVVCFATGFFANLLASDTIQHCQQGGQLGWTAGFWAGIMGGIVAMILAATGFTLTDFGQSIVTQLSPERLSGWYVDAAPETVALAGRVGGALVVYGVIGSLVCALIGSIGGMIYPMVLSGTFEHSKTSRRDRSQRQSHKYQNQ